MLELRYRILKLMLQREIAAYLRESTTKKEQTRSFLRLERIDKKSIGFIKMVEI